MAGADEPIGLLEAPLAAAEDGRPLVFVSYGRADAVDLAERLERDLGGEFRVWRDRTALHGGEVFTSAIREAIERSAVVIGILSPHAMRDGPTRDKRSLCLNELHEASERLGKPVVLAMAETCTPPLFLNDMHWVDFRDRREPGRYEAALDELRRSLRHVLAGGRAPRVEWFEYAPTLRPAFDLFLAERHELFCGRQWVFDEIEEWRRRRSEKAMLIMGEPGIGKSTIVADLVERNPGGQVLAYHCCRRDDVATLRPGRFVRSIAVLLAQRLEAYAARLAQRDVREELSESNCQEIPEHAFEAGVLAPLRDIPSPEAAKDGACYILVDSLDEAAFYRRSASQRTIVDILEPRLAMFPPWLRVLATTRPGVGAERLRDIYVCRLRARDRRNLRDIRAYVAARLAPIKDKLPPRTSATLIHRSGGNFLYLKFAIDAILAGRFRGEELDRLPQGLAGLYLADFNQHFGDPPGEAYAATVRLLAAMAVAQHPLDPQHLARAAGVPTDEVLALLAPLAAYVPERGGALVFFHKSFADWLRDQHNPFHINETAGHAQHARLAEEILRALEAEPDIEASATADPVSQYVLRHGAYHFVRCGRFADAVDLLALLAEHQGEIEAITKPVLDGLTKFVVVALDRCTPEEAERIDPMKLAGLLHGFYEIEPLASALELLVRHPRSNRPALIDDLLRADNFVLRYALSEALADACTVARPAVTVTELAALLEGDTLERRELGGYALRLVYSRKPELIDRRHLETLAESETYPGRSILGDLLLNLAFQRRFRRDLVASERFWRPVWDFHKLDVWDLEAAEAFFGSRPLAPDAASEAADAFAMLQTIEGWRQERLRGDDAPIRSLLDGYFSLGRFVGRFRRAREALAKRPELAELMRLFFAHPLWAVAEAAASVLSSLAEEDPARRGIVTELFDDPRWRVRFGAIEAAFAIRHLDQGTSFFEAVRRFHGDANCRVRALCAENLVAMIVNRGPLAGGQLVEAFSEEIRTWLRDEDCWVLEHAFRLVRTLDARGADLSPLFAAGVSRLFADAPEWYRLPREAFLVHIEKRKREVAPPSPRVVAGPDPAISDAPARPGDRVRG